MALIHTGAEMLLKDLIAPLRTHEMAGVGGIHPALRPEDVLVVDRNG